MSMCLPSALSLKCINFFKKTPYTDDQIEIYYVVMKYDILVSQLISGCFKLYSRNTLQIMRQSFHKVPLFMCNISSKRMPNCVDLLSPTSKLIIFIAIIMITKQQKDRRIPSHGRENIVRRHGDGWWGSVVWAPLLKGVRMRARNYVKNVQLVSERYRGWGKGMGSIRPPRKYKEGLFIRRCCRCEN